MNYFDYSDGHTTFEGYLAADKNLSSRRPCVLIGHAWSGAGAPFNAIADEMATKGFIGIAFDVYGKGVRGTLDGDNSHLMNPLLEDRALLQRRLLAAFDVARNHPLVMPDKLAVLGHCFGGLCALDLARANPPGLRGAISIHGLFNKPNLPSQGKISASVLALHGWSDPLAPPPDVVGFAQEMTEAGADWQLHAYGHAMHAFTFEGANIPDLGIKYDEKAHKRSQASIAQFLNELFE